MTQVVNSGYEVVALEHLVPYPGNPRRGDVGLITESVAANGFYGAVVAQRSTRYVLAGNHRLAAAAAAGLSELPVIWVEVDDATARRILLADNRTNDLAGYDNERLAALLGSLEDLTGTGYITEDISTLLGADRSADLETFTAGDSDAESRNPASHTCPSCGSVFEK